MVSFHRNTWYTLSEINIDALKYSLNNFIENIKEKDRAFIYSFSNITYTAQDWTNDKSLLHQAVNNMFPMGGTQFWGAILDATKK